MDGAGRHRRRRTRPSHHDLAVRTLRVAWPGRISGQDPLRHAQRIRWSRGKEAVGGDVHHRLEILSDPQSVARNGAVLVAEAARGAVGSHGTFQFAVSGGHTPWAMFAELASEMVPWDRVVIYQVD